MSLVERRVQPKDLPLDSELKQIEGCLQELRVVEMGNGDRLLCKDSAVYVPKGVRSSILKTLHLTHSAPDSMLACRKGRVYWPAMRQQLHKLYNNCQECSLHKISKSRPPNECSQSNLFENYYPNSFLQADFLEFLGQNYMTMVDTLTGYEKCSSPKTRPRRKL